MGLGFGVPRYKPEPEAMTVDLTGKVAFIAGRNWSG